MDPKRSHPELDVPTLPTRAGFVHDQLREWIVAGTLEPGQKLDQEWLASTLHVSRTPLRQALMRLESEGLVEHRPYVGAIVTDLSVADLEDVYATRGALEAMLAREGTLRRSPDSVAGAEQLLESQKAEKEGFVDLDRKFHLAIYAPTGFRTALSFLDRLFNRSERYARVYAQHESGLRRSVVEHRQIYEAFRDGNADAARRLTAEHIAHGKSMLLDLVSASMIESADAEPGLNTG